MESTIASEVQAAIDAIGRGFRWATTPQGFEYWRRVQENLHAVKDRERKCPQCGREG